MILLDTSVLKEEIVVYCEMGSRQRKIYDRFKEECHSRVEGILES
jgi:SNF2 family DNA or RNA helicase